MLAGTSCIICDISSPQKSPREIEFIYLQHKKLASQSPNTQTNSRVNEGGSTGAGSSLGSLPHQQNIRKMLPVCSRGRQNGLRPPTNFPTGHHRQHTLPDTSPSSYSRCQGEGATLTRASLTLEMVVFFRFSITVTSMWLPVICPKCILETKQAVMYCSIIVGNIRKPSLQPLCVLDTGFFLY